VRIVRFGSNLQNENVFLASIQTMYRMDRGDRIYVRRHFQRWLDVAKIIKAIQAQSVPLKFLDVGCGSGFFMLVLGGMAIGVDGAENVEVCRRRGLQAFPINLETDQFPFKDEFFDVVTCLEVLEHLEDPGNMLCEIFRVLKPNRHLILSTPNSRMPSWRIRDFLLKFRLISRIYMGRDLGSDQKRYSRAEISEMLLSYGFKVSSFCFSKILLPCDDLIAFARKAQ
jgi:2-polyprenyl-3-methyl-5-hydroxy-6-metoxy-1,4-benzoquinol methylase